ncbi:MAG: hypothetical protein JOZ29_22090, partial [Deltaproteobacteria bacterium]|nr:hypothetical protein [Deltaproteobacteria bacterium]
GIISSVNSGFAPPRHTLFAPVLALGPPGPNRGARAIEAINRIIPFVRRFFFHPEFNRELEHVIDQMPPRASTLIRAGALYANSGILWKRQADLVHEIAVTGRPDNSDFAFSIVPDYAQPVAPFNFAGVFAVTPIEPLSPDTSGLIPHNVLGRLVADVSLENFGAAAMMDVAAMSLRETHGDQNRLWDVRQGEFNSHDRGALVRLRRDAPKLSERLAHYFEIHNLLDEFSTPEGPFVLVNIDARVRTEALKPYPDLSLFYNRLAPRVTIDSNIIDQRGNRWLFAGFDHGRIRLVFGLRDGMLVPLNARWRPAGDAVDLSRIRQGHWRAVSTITLEKFRAIFGLENIDFTTAYRRTGDALVLTSHMDSVPQLIAPPGIKQVSRFAADEFLSGLARGHGGATISLTSGRDTSGVFHIAMAFTGELHYSPILAMLAHIGDTIVEANDVRVRNDERRLTQEFFDALVADFNNARPELLGLDGCTQR